MSELRKTTKNVHILAMVGVMGALAFAANYLSVPLPAIAGTPTRIHLGNVMCLLAGLILGPLPGGLAAGFGGMFYDFTNPVYVADAPFTLAFKFTMAFLCGKVAYAGGADAKNQRRNIVAGACGQFTYVILYLCKNFFQGLYFDRLAMETVIAVLIQKGAASVANGVIAVVVAVPLALALRRGLDHARLMPQRDSR